MAEFLEKRQLNCESLVS